MAHEIRAPGLTLQEVLPILKPDTFLARLSPLALFKVVAADDCAAEATIWTPEAVDSIVFVPPLSPKDFRFLPFETSPGLKPWRFSGNVVATPDGRLWFAGPGTHTKVVHVIADWQVDEHGLFMSNVIQHGPPPPSGPKTRLERV
jgi:hypothetical protein